jgi:glycosyltransferase involved in cell wall biosynthesis
MLRIAYLLEDTDIAGGIRVSLAHADALIARGHAVTLVTKGQPLSWRQSRASWSFVSGFEELDASPFDFVVGTFWTTLSAAHRIAGARAIHLCQGYEGSFTAYRSMRADIESAYRLPIPKITVSPHLVEICAQFFPDATYVGQIVDDEFFRPHAPRGGRPRVLLVGPAQADFKGIDVGYEAVRHARSRGTDLDLIRVSQWKPDPGEPAGLAQEFHVGLSSADMAALIASCDVYLGPSRTEEGFGLPAAESMASGVPAILSSIPSFLSWDATHDYARFVPEGDGTAMGNALVEVLASTELRHRLAVRGREVVQQFRAPVTAARLETYFSSRV